MHSRYSGVFHTSYHAHPILPTLENRADFLGISSNLPFLFGAYSGHFRPVCGSWNVPIKSRSVSFPEPIPRPRNRCMPAPSSPADQARFIPKSRLSNKGKMCFVIQNHLGKGGASRPPVASLHGEALSRLREKPSCGNGFVWHGFGRHSLQTPPRHKTVSPVYLSEDSGDMPLPPAPSPCINGCPFNRQSGERPALPPITPTAISSRPRAEDSRSPPWNPHRPKGGLRSPSMERPSTKAFAPLDHDLNRAVSSVFAAAQKTAAPAVSWKRPLPKNGVYNPMNTFIVWNGVRIDIACNMDYSPICRQIYGEAIAHLEIRSVRKEPLPITETGYRSHFVATDFIEEYGGPAEYVRCWLDYAAARSSKRRKRTKPIC
jgi:hypothetical protein